MRMEMRMLMVHSTFYYNHRLYIEAMSEISDYEGDDIGPDGDYSLYTEPRSYTSHSNS